MRLRLVLLLAAAASLVACAQASQPTPKTDEDKAFYSLGVILSKNTVDLQTFDFTDAELELVKAGLADGARNKSLFDDKALQTHVPKLQELQGKRAEVVLKREKDAGAAYITKMAAEAGAKKTASGLVYKEVKAGAGAAPKETDVVKVYYEGKFANGKMFDSSVNEETKEKEAATFPLNGVIACWGEGVQLMKVGGKAHIVCPPELAYGDEGRPPKMPGGATLSFDVELLEIVDPAVEAAAAHAHAEPKK